MVYATGQPIFQNSCSFELRGLKYTWATTTDIGVTSVESSEFYNVFTDQNETSILQDRNEILTCTGILTSQLIQKVKEIYLDSKKGITTAATHIAGSVITDLEGVKIVNYSYGAYSKTSADTVNCTIEVSYGNAKVR